MIWISPSPQYGWKFECGIAWDCWLFGIVFATTDIPAFYVRFGPFHFGWCYWHTPEETSKRYEAMVARSR